MSLFPQSVAPAVRSHIDAQVAFLNDISKSWTRSFQNIVEANIQLSQTLLEESNLASRRLLTNDHPSEILSTAASRAQPAAEKLRAYQQHISRVVADSQVDLSRVAEQHVAETSRTARTLASEVARVASEETQKSIRTHEDTLKNFRDPFQEARADSHAQHGNLQSAGNGSGNGADIDGRDASLRGNAQGEVRSGQQGQQSGKSASGSRQG